MNLRVGVISDTHKKIGRAKKAIDFLLTKDIEYLIHSGDIVKIEILEYIESLNIPYVAILGNNDSHLIEFSNQFKLYSEPYYFKIEDITFKLMHHPLYMSSDSDIVIYGHTHISEAQMKNRTLYLNSGEVCGRDFNKSECMVLDILNDRYLVEYYFREIKSKIWKREFITFSL